MALAATLVVGGLTGISRMRSRRTRSLEQYRRFALAMALKEMTAGGRLAANGGRTATRQASGLARERLSEAQRTTGAALSEALSRAGESLRGSFDEIREQAGEALSKMRTQAGQKGSLKLPARKEGQKALEQVVEFGRRRPIATQCAVMLIGMWLTTAFLAPRIAEAAVNRVQKPSVFF